MSFLDSLAKRLYGRTKQEALAEGICISCGKKANFFTDQISRKEYGISGMCQSCQDEFFVEEDEEEEEHDE